LVGEEVLEGVEHGGYSSRNETRSQAEETGDGDR
jgi:hypothetical protein